MNDRALRMGIRLLMAQFFFDVVLDGRSEPADSPVELESPERARAEAIALAAEILRACSPRCRDVAVTVRDVVREPLTSVRVSVAVQDRPL